MTEATLVQRYPRYSTNVPVEVLELDSSRVRSLSLENISLGGAFVRELWVPLGTPLVLRIAALDGIEASARAVHLVDTAAAERKGHPPGVGLRFDPLTAVARGKLLEFFEGISAATLWPLEPPPRPAVLSEAPGLVRTLAQRVKPGVVEVAFGSVPELLDLWVRDLSKGRLFVHTAEYAVLRARLEVRLRAAHGTFTLETEVVHQVVFAPASEPAFGLGLQLAGFAAVKERLEQFLRGAQAPVPAAPDPEQASRLAAVLDEVKRFFAGLETGQPRHALGLSAQATPLEHRARLVELERLFSRTPGGASAPQLARLDAALRALTRLDRQQAVRDQAVGQLALVPEETPVFRPGPPPPPPSTAYDDLEPDQHSADALISQAEVFITTDMRSDAREAILEALELDCDEPLLERAIGVCMRTGDVSMGVAISQRVLAANPKSASAWRALLTIYEQKGHFALALRAAQALQGLEPRDAQHRARVSKLKGLASRA